MTDRTTSTLGTAAAVAAGDEELTVHTGNTSESGFDGALDDSGAAATGKHPGTAAPLSRPTAQGTPSNGMPSSALTQASLGREIEGLVLFDLTTKEGARAAFSPHVSVQ